jgi:hypothetical protein
MLHVFHRINQGFCQLKTPVAITLKQMINKPLRRFIAHTRQGAKSFIERFNHNLLFLKR